MLGNTFVVLLSQVSRGSSKTQEQGIPQCSKSRMNVHGPSSNATTPARHIVPHSTRSSLDGHGRKFSSRVSHGRSTYPPPDPYAPYAARSFFPAISAADDDRFVPAVGASVGVSSAAFKLWSIVAWICWKSVGSIASSSRLQHMGRASGMQDSLLARL